MLSYWTDWLTEIPDLGGVGNLSVSYYYGYSCRFSRGKSTCISSPSESYYYCIQALLLLLNSGRRCTTATATPTSCVGSRCTTPTIPPPPTSTQHTEYAPYTPPNDFACTYHQAVFLPLTSPFAVSLPLMTSLPTQQPRKARKAVLLAFYPLLPPFELCQTSLAERSCLGGRRGDGGLPRVAGGAG